MRNNIWGNCLKILMPQIPFPILTESMETISTQTASITLMENTEVNIPQTVSTILTAPEILTLMTARTILMETGGKSFPMISLHSRFFSFRLFKNG